MPFAGRISAFLIRRVLCSLFFDRLSSWSALCYTGYDRVVIFTTRDCLSCRLQLFINRMLHVYMASCIRTIFRNTYCIVGSVWIGHIVSQRAINGWHNAYLALRGLCYKLICDARMGFVVKYGSNTQCIIRIQYNTSYIAEWRYQLPWLLTLPGK